MSLSFTLNKNEKIQYLTRKPRKLMMIVRFYIKGDVKFLWFRPDGIGDESSR